MRRDVAFIAAFCCGIPDDDGGTLEAAVITVTSCWSSIDKTEKYSAIKHASLRRDWHAEETRDKVKIRVSLCRDFSFQNYILRLIENILRNANGQIQILAK